MASIIKRNDKWFVRVRKQGQLSKSKTFNIKKDAQRWVAMIERELDQDSLVTTVSGALVAFKQIQLFYNLLA